MGNYKDADYERSANTLWYTERENTVPNLIFEFFSNNNILLIMIIIVIKNKETQMGHQKRYLSTHLKLGELQTHIPYGYRR